MTSSDDIINTLAGKTKTMGYDAVVAYDRDKINHLLEQQYVSKRANGVHLPPVNWTNSDGTVRLSNLTLSEPRISFENSSITDSRVSVTMEFIMGSIAKINSDNQVIRYTRIRPGAGFFLRLDVDLKKGGGTVDEQGHIVLDLSAGSVNATNIDNDPAAEIIPYFEQWLKNNPVSYSVGQLSEESLGTALTPTEFIIRTQPHPDAQDGDGAVLLFVLTTAHPADNVTSLPDASYPWLIPAEHSSAILLNNRMVMGTFIKTAMDKILDDGEWTLQRDGESDDAAWELVASDDATLRRGYVRMETEGDDWSVAWSGEFKDELGDAYGEVNKDFIIGIGGARLAGNSNGIALDLNNSLKFSNQFAGKFWHCSSGPTGDSCGDLHEKGDISFTLAGTGEYELNVNSAGEQIMIAGKNSNVSVTNNFDDTLGHLVSIYEGPSLAEQMRAQLDDTLNQTIVALLDSVVFDAISVFAVDHLLFPEQNINQLKSAGMPGDMIVFGDIVTSLTSLNVMPLISTIAAGQSMQFTANADVSWAVNPVEGGTISNDGLYQAPANLDSTLLNVRITATGTDGATASAYIAVVPLPVMIAPAFVAVKEVEGTPSTVNFSAALTDSSTLSRWSVEPAEEDGLTGSIDANGIYTSPEDDYPKGYSWINVKATSSDGQTATALVLLISRTTHAEFPVTPPLLTEMTLGSEQVFSATGDGDINPDTWALYPPEGSGTLSDPEVSGEDDEPVYTVNYTSPEAVNGDELVIITTVADGLPTRAGYAVVDVANKKNNPWNLLEGLTTLKVTNEAGGGTAELYKNGLNQVALKIQIAGFRNDSNTGIPESVNVTLDEILPHLELVDYVSGEPLQRASTIGWTYNTQANEYNRLPVSNALTEEREASSQAADSFTLYLSCNADETSSAKKIAVSITLPDNTVISTASGASSGFDSSVLINGLEAIDYSASSGISLTSQSSLATKAETAWASHDVTTSEYVDRKDKCEIQTRQFYIKPDAPNITKFKKAEFSGGKVTDTAVSLIQLNWKDELEFVFKCLSSSGTQCAAMGVTAKDKQEGSANIWFTSSTAVLDEGQIYFSDEEKSTLYRVTIPDFKDDSENTDDLTITQLKIKCPQLDADDPGVKPVKPYHWQSVDLKPRLKVTDIYGNSGTLNITWDEGDNYDTPHIS